MQDYFADIVGNISITGPLVRIEFMRVKPGAKQNEPLVAPTGHAAGGVPTLVGASRGDQEQIACRWSDFEII